MADNKNEQQVLDSKASVGNVIGPIGGSFPVITINGYTFTDRDVRYLEISTMEFQPTIILTVKTADNMFLHKHFPKDGDVINIFIRSMNDTFKPIRNDYLITYVDTGKSKDAEGNQFTISFHGILKIPNLYAEVTNIIKDKTSYEALAEMATKLKLGYVTNETKTDDKQTWICAQQTNEGFIESITKHAYKDVYNFYDSWIDIYYNLNFMNLNSVLSVKDDDPWKEGLYKSVGQDDFNADKKMNFQKVKNFLSNAPDTKVSNFYYNSIELINRSGELNCINGYARNVFFYNKNQKKLINFKIEPTITEGAEKNKILLKGRAKENYYKTETKSKWTGMQYALPDHNVHANYKTAEIQNFQNNQELKKINVLVRMPSLNYNLYKGQKIPLVFTYTDSPKEEAGSIRPDKFLSGNYLILGCKYIYKKKDEFSQEILLTRREWPVPVQNLEDWNKV